MRKVIFYTSIGLLLVSCNRELTKDRSLVRINIPASLQKSDFNSNALRCFAINVTGGGIPTEKNACSPVVGSRAGFTSSGTVEMEVARGESRRVELYMVEVSDNGTCPAWDATFQANSKINFGRVYRVAEKTVNVNQEIVPVELAVQMPAVTQTLLAEQAACPKGSIQGKVLSSGDILNSADARFSPDQSSPKVASISKADESTSSASGQGIVTSGNFYQNGSFEIQFPEHLQAVSQKPDSKEFFGLQADGAIVRIDLSTGQALALTASTCPFLSCSIPLWAESISAGLGNDLFFKDHGGQLYKVLAGGGHELLTVPAVSPFTYQVVMF